MKKTIFKFNIDNVIDIITNSSSELFVLNGQTKEIVTEMVRSIYPSYETEYEVIKSIDDLTIEELDTYFDYACSSHMWPARKHMYPVLEGFTFDELYVAKSEKPAHNGEIQYELKNNIIDPKHSWNSSYVTEENFEEIKNKLDPNRSMFFLFSLNDNPNWDMQELLMGIGDRYHLG
jgi:hypothetical protein